MKPLLVLSISTLLMTTISAHAHNYFNFYQQCILEKNGVYNYELEEDQKWIDKELYTPIALDDLILNKVGEFVVRNGYAVKEILSSVRDEEEKKKLIIGSWVRNEVINDIKSVIKNYKLDKYEQACLLKCAASSLVDLTTKGSELTKLASVTRIYYEGVGNCTEQTSLYRDLATAIGLPNRSAFSEQQQARYTHVWAEVFIKGKWWNVDPSSPMCTYFAPLPGKKN